MFRFWPIFGFFALGLALPAISHAQAETQTEPFLVGGDLSFLKRIEDLGGVYRDAGKPKDALEILREKGANVVRLRLWVAPDGQNMNVSDLPYTLALAKRVKAQGFQFLLDLHFSDVWADPGQQTKPQAWKELNFAELTQKVEDYSRETVAEFAKNGALPDMVQIGNETPNGMLWPDGKTLELGGWARFATLFKAGARGVKISAPNAQIMIHINNADDAGLWNWFFDELKQKGGEVPFDVIGLSYYPGPQSRLATLKNSLADLAKKLGKPIMVVETGYPFAENDAQKAAQWEFGATPHGQKIFLQKLIQIVREVPNNLGRGVVWWEPAWVPIHGLGHYSGPKMLWDEKFEALPALNALTAQIKP